MQEAEGRHIEQAATERRQTLRLYQQYLRHLVSTARLAAPENPSLEALFPLATDSRSNRAFITATKALLVSATEQRVTLEAAGLSDTFVTDLTAAIAEFEAASVEAHGARAARVGATADLSEVATECVKLVKLLDGLVRGQFAKDPERLGAWVSATNVFGYTPRRSTEPVVAPGPVVTLPAPVQPGMSVQVM